MKTAIVIPTIRESSYKDFCVAWKDLIAKHDVTLITVHDTDSGPRLSVGDQVLSVTDVMGDFADVIFDHTTAVRNLGFAYVYRYMLDVDVIITLDDDVVPVGDTIQDHLDVLAMRVPVSWMSTASEYTRGFPYAVRQEAEVVLSHGVWEGVKDYDALTQLVNGNRDVTFYRGPVPRGVLFPVCSMNLAFVRKLTPYMYLAPMGHRVGIDRFEDIWMGINAKREIDQRGWAAVTGYACVHHERASNVWKNLRKEVCGLELNETFWKGNESDPYFKLYHSCYDRWMQWMLQS